MDSEAMVLPGTDCWRAEFEKAAGRTADPSTSLRFGRDDKGRGVTQVGVVSGKWRDLLFLPRPPSKTNLDKSDFQPSLRDSRRVFPQPVKPPIAVLFSARLKPCPSRI